MKVSIIPWIVKKLKLGLALVEDGDTASQNIASGKYVSWKGSMCQASSAISSGDALSSSNLTAVEGGALNALNGKITNITEVQLSLGSGTNSTLTYISDCKAYLCGKTIHVRALGSATGYAKWTNYVLFTLPSNMTFKDSGWTVSMSNAGQPCVVEYGGNSITMRPLDATLSSGQFRFAFTALIN